MFGLSWGQIAIIVLVGVFVLGPERIPTAVTWVLSNLRKLRTMAAGAQAELRKEIGPELEELRRQVADLQSLKEIQELRDLRDLHPKRLIGKNILGDEFSGGITGFLGLNEPVKGAENAVEPDAAGSTNGTGSIASNGGLNGNDVTNGNHSNGDASNGNAGNGSSSNGNGSIGSGPNDTVAADGISATNGSVLNVGARSAADANGGAMAAAVWPGPGSGGPTPPHLPPSMAKLAAPKVVGGTTPPRAPARALPEGEHPPFDPDGT